MRKEALFYQEEKGKVRCELCPHRCLIAKDHTGRCGVRECGEAAGGLKLFTLNYGEITSISLDPVKKKPLYHFFPDKNILSIGTFGCNFKCSFCQNYSISQHKAGSEFISADRMAEISLEQNSSIGLAFTYNEPSIWYEYVVDVARKLKERESQHKIVLVSNGYISEEPLRQLLRYVDAMNIDLKGDEDFYESICGGKLEPVKETIKTARAVGCHIEVATLLIPGGNTGIETITRLADFLASVDRNIVLHLSRYFPRYRMNKPKTSLEDMKNAYRLAKARLNNVYAGNVEDWELEYIYGGG